MFRNVSFATVMCVGLLGPMVMAQGTGRPPLPPPAGQASPTSQAPPPVQSPTAPTGLPVQTLLASPNRAAEARSDLPLIGYDAFKIDVSAIPPGPVDKSYVLSPGDVVHVRVWGELQLTFQLTVSSDHYLEIPGVLGRVYTADLPLGDVTDRVMRHLATAHAVYFDLENPAASTAFVDVTLGEVRGIQFLVQGEVATPGSYLLHPSLGNLIYAIAKAGGVKDSGSLRNVRIRRGTRTFEVDFYQFLLKGTVDGTELQIRNGDLIFVPLKRKEVTIQGQVRRQGVYTLLAAGHEDLDEMIDYAGGVLPTAITERILIRRSEVNVGTRTISVNLDAEAAAKRQVPLQDQDVVTILASDTRRRDYITLQGNGVPLPGEYQFTPGMRIQELLVRAGGLRPEAYLERAELRRTGPDLRTSYLHVDLRLAAAGNPAHNVVIESLDELTVNSVIDVVGAAGEVSLAGHVKTPGTVPLSSGMRVYDLLFTRAGLQDADFMRDTFLRRGDIIRVVRGTVRTELLTFDLGKLLEGDQAQNLLLQADDKVVIYERNEILGTDRTVTLSGFVRSPGTHSLLQGMRLLDLLRNAGGFEDPDRRRDAYLPRGEIWRIVGRGDRVERELLRFDLGAALGGDPAQNLPLQSGDEVIVYAARDFVETRTVEIDGAVNKPGVYELASNMTMGDLLVKGGGLKDLADPKMADLFRMGATGDGELRLESVAVPLSDTSLVLRNRDRLLVRMRSGYQPTRVIDVSGEVQYPGRYTLSGGAERLADVIRMAGGVLPDAFLEGASLHRRDGTGAEASTRVVLDFARALRSPDSPDNLLLEHGDRLHVTRRSNTVTVVDAVQRPITIAFAKGKGVQYYLQAAGGVTADADAKGVAVVLPSGRYAPSRFLRGPDIVPGSTIVVPSKTGAIRPQAPEPVVVAPPPAPLPPAQAPEVAAPTVSAVPVASWIISGIAGPLTGTCPALAFDIGSSRITSTEATVFVGTPCADLKAGDQLEVTAVRQTERMLVALEIRRR